MKPFNIKLSDEDRAGLERARISMGVRSHAEVVRRWIALFAGDEGEEDFTAPARFVVTERMLPMKTDALGVFGSIKENVAEGLARRNEALGRHDLADAIRDVDAAFRPSASSQKPSPSRVSVSLPLGPQEAKPGSRQKVPRKR